MCFHLVESVARDRGGPAGTASGLPRTRKREHACSRTPARASQSSSRDYSSIRRITKQAPRSRHLSHFRTDVHVTDTEPDFFIERWLWRATSTPGLLRAACLGRSVSEQSSPPSIVRR